MLDRIVLHGALAANHGDALGVDRGHREDDLFGRETRAEEYADMDPVAECGSGADCLDAVDDDALLVGLDNAQRRRARLRVRRRTIGLRIDELRRAVQIVVPRELEEVDDVLRQPPPLGADRGVFPGLRIVDIGEQRVIVGVGHARKRRTTELAHDGLVISALAPHLFLVAVAEPLHRAANAVLIDEGHDVLQILAVMQVVKIGNAAGIAASLRMGCDVVDLLVSDPYIAAVIEGFQILCASA